MLSAFVSCILWGLIEIMTSFRTGSSSHVMDEKPGREQMKQLVLRSGTDEDMKRSLGFVTSKWGQEKIKELWMWPLTAYLIFFSSWIDIRKHHRQKKRNLVVIWGGNGYDCDNTTQDGWQPCAVLYRTGICHHHAAIFHHLKLTEEKFRNGCGVGVSPSPLPTTIESLGAEGAWPARAKPWTWCFTTVHSIGCNVGWRSSWWVAVGRWCGLGGLVVGIEEQYMKQISSMDLFVMLILIFIWYI